MNQGPLDIAIQEYGSVQGVMALLEDNPDAFTLESPYLAPGTELQIREDADIRAVTGSSLSVTRALLERLHKPANGLREGEGIGWMVIEDTFIVA